MAPSHRRQQTSHSINQRLTRLQTYGRFFYVYCQERNLIPSKAALLTRHLRCGGTGCGKLASLNGTGLQAVHNCYVMNSALEAAEGCFLLRTGHFPAACEAAPVVRASTMKETPDQNPAMLSFGFVLRPDFQSGRKESKRLWALALHWRIPTKFLCRPYSEVNVPAGSPARL
jgi:hypothetical protein